jgi:hypothetical protein
VRHLKTAGRSGVLPSSADGTAARSFSTADTEARKFSTACKWRGNAARVRNFSTANNRAVAASRIASKNAAGTDTGIQKKYTHRAYVKVSRGVYSLANPSPPPYLQGGCNRLIKQEVPLKTCTDIPCNGNTTKGLIELQNVVQVFWTLTVCVNHLFSSLSSFFFFSGQEHCHHLLRFVGLPEAYIR